MELESPQEHALWHLLKGFLRLSYARLRWELRQRGHNVSERRLSLMLRGLTQIPPEIETALKHVGAEGIQGRPVEAEYVDEIIEPWYSDDDEPDEDTDERQRSARETDRLYNELLEAYDDPKRLDELVTEF